MSRRLAGSPPGVDVCDDDAQDLALVARTGSASSATPGAITASMKVDTSARAVAASIARLSPMMPPNAASLSASRARTYA